MKDAEFVPTVLKIPPREGPQESSAVTRGGCIPAGTRCPMRGGRGAEGLLPCARGQPEPVPGEEPVGWQRRLCRDPHRQ